MREELDKMPIHLKLLRRLEGPSEKLWIHPSQRAEVKGKFIRNPCLHLPTITKR